MQEKQHDYEMVVILNPQLDDEGLAGVNNRISGWITGAGGTVANTNVWGRRRLVYGIAKHTTASTCSSTIR